MTANETEGGRPHESTDEETIILCDHCLLPVDPEEAVSQGIEDYHPDCPQEKTTEEEERALLESKRPKLAIDVTLTTPAKPIAAYPAPNAAFPFVWFDVETDHGELSLALPTEDAAKWGKALQRAAEGCEDQ